MAFRFEVKHGMLIFVLVGGIFALVGAYIHSAGERTKSWPVTDGTIESSQLESYMSTSTSGSGSSRRTSTTEMFRPQIRYRYQVDGREFSGTRVWAVDYSSSGRGEMQAVVDRYPVGQAAQVHYDPEKPENAVLETGAGWLGTIFMAIGIFFVLLGSILFKVIGSAAPGRVQSGPSVFTSDHDF